MRVRLGELRRALREAPGHWSDEQAHTAAETKEGFDIEELRATPKDDLEDYLITHARYLNHGVARQVYDTGLGYVIKLARYKKDRKQNESEFDISSCSPNAPVPKIIDHEADLWWLAVEKVEHITGKQLDRAIKVTTGLSGVEQLIYVLEAGVYGRNGTSDDWADGLPDHKRLYQTNEWYRDIFDMVTNCHLIPTELHSDNWGLDENGDLVLLDPGG